jgi:hypothetical protein
LPREKPSAVTPTTDVSGLAAETTSRKIQTVLRGRRRERGGDAGVAVLDIQLLR